MMIQFSDPNFRKWSAFVWNYRFTLFFMGQVWVDNVPKRINLHNDNFAQTLVTKNHKISLEIVCGTGSWICWRKFGLSFYSARILLLKINAFIITWLFALAWRLITLSEKMIENSACMRLAWSFITEKRGCEKEEWE